MSGPDNQLTISFSNLADNSLPSQPGVPNTGTPPAFTPENVGINSDPRAPKIQPFAPQAPPPPNPEIAQAPPPITAGQILPTQGPPPPPPLPPANPQNLSPGAQSQVDTITILRENLRPGEEVTVTRPDGTTITFSKGNFTEEIQQQTYLPPTTNADTRATTTGSEESTDKDLDERVEQTMEDIQEANLRTPQELENYLTSRFDKEINYSPEQLEGMLVNQRELAASIRGLEEAEEYTEDTEEEREKSQGSQLEQIQDRLASTVSSFSSNLT